ELEKKFKVEALTFKGLKVWPIIRSNIYFQYLGKKYDFDSNKRKYWAALKSIFYGLRKLLLKKTRYILFNNTNKRMLIDGKYFDIYFDSIADTLGQDKCLFIEWSAGSYKPYKKLYSEHVVSDAIFKFASRIMSYLIRASSNKDIKEICNKFGLHYNYVKDIKTKYSLYILYRYYLKISNPKKIFLISYYTKMPLVIAANELDIEIIELQHGLINTSHHGYYTKKKFTEEYYPDKLFAYGSNLVNSYSDDFIFERNKIFPVGFFYLEYIKKEYKNSYLQELKDKYNQIICVTLQNINVSSIIDCVNVLANKYSEKLFVIRFKKDVTYRSNKKNVVTLNGYDVYQVLKYSSINITIYSTVAIEASFLEVGSVLLNYDGLSEKHLGKMDIMKNIIDPNMLET